MRSPRIGFVLLALLAGGCVVRAPDKPATVDNVVRQFETVAFSSDFGRGSGMVTRWTRKPRLRILAEPDMLERHREDIAEALRIVEGVTPAEPADEGEADVALAFVPRARFAEAIAAMAPQASVPDEEAQRQFTDTSACMGSLFGTGGVIEGAVILIGEDNHESVRRRCITEEVVQSAGLPADACAYAPSLFCESNHADRPTPADEVLLRTLYDPRLKPGMPRVVAMPIARNIIRELMG